MSLPSLGCGGQPDCAANTLALHGHECKSESCDKSLAVKRSENSVLIQVISIAEENCGLEKQHSFSKVIEWIYGWVTFRIQDSWWGSLPYATS